MADTKLRADSAHDNPALAILSETRDVFDRLLEAYLAAHLEHELYPTDGDEAEDNRLYDRWSAAEEAVLRRAAPDIEGVLAKIEIGTRDGQSLEPQWVDRICADLMVLGNIRRSPTFQPQKWLHYFETVLHGRGVVSTLNGQSEPMLIVPVLSTDLTTNRALDLVTELKAHEAAAISDYLMDEGDIVELPGLLKPRSTWA